MSKKVGKLLILPGVALAVALGVARRTQASAWLGRQVGLKVYPTPMLW